MGKYRKAIAAFVVPFLSLPLAGWISGEVPFDKTLIVSTGIAAVTGLLTYFFPNAPAA